MKEECRVHEESNHGLVLSVFPSSQHPLHLLLRGSGGRWRWYSKFPRVLGKAHTTVRVESPYPRILSSRTTAGSLGSFGGKMIVIPIQRILEFPRGIPSKLILKCVMKKRDRVLSDDFREFLKKSFADALLILLSLPTPPKPASDLNRIGQMDKISIGNVRALCRKDFS